MKRVKSGGTAKRWDVQSVLLAVFTGIYVAGVIAGAAVFLHCEERGELFSHAREFFDVYRAERGDSFFAVWQNAYWEGLLPSLLAAVLCLFLFAELPGAALTLCCACRAGFLMTAVFGSADFLPAMAFAAATALVGLPTVFLTARSALCAYRLRQALGAGRAVRLRPMLTGQALLFLVMQAPAVLAALLEALVL